MLTMSKSPATATSGFVVEIHIIDGRGECGSVLYHRVFCDLDIVDHASGITIARYGGVFDAAGAAEDYAHRLLARTPRAVGGRVWFWVTGRHEQPERYIHWAYVRI